MEFPLFWILVSCAISMTLTFPLAANSKIIKFDFGHCHKAVLRKITDNDICCPIKPTKPIIDGMPPLSSTKIRVRKALQCVDAGYATKLNKAYALMRALPDDDPRSFVQQVNMHCAYCGGSMVDIANHGPVGMVDIHMGWYFFPFHRVFIYFHERILQSLLKDPTFSLSYWNWDNPYTVGDGSSQTGACLKQGHDFPVFYDDPHHATYDVNRSDRAKGTGRFRFPDLTFSPDPDREQTLYNASEQVLVESNLHVMHQAMVRGAKTTETFMGRHYHQGDGETMDMKAAGSLEGSVHAAVHFWTALPSPDYDDMGLLIESARDPIFYTHHGNVDRLWEVWKSMGNKDYSDPDFLNAEFLLYDEKKELRRVKVADALDTTKLGYVYQDANDAAWMYLKQTKCSQLTNHELIARAKTSPLPTQDSNGHYHLQFGTPFTILVNRPDNPHGLEEFLTIGGINLERSSNAGFDVFVNLLNPGDYKSPWRCAEYSGRFMHMSQNHLSIHEKQNLGWKQSITRTLVDIHAHYSPSKLVITLVPLSLQSDNEILKFNSITVHT